jgi:hypothetical protein
VKALVVSMFEAAEQAPHTTWNALRLCMEASWLAARAGGQACFIPPTTA